MIKKKSKQASTAKELSSTLMQMANWLRYKKGWAGLAVPARAGGSGRRRGAVAVLEERRLETHCPRDVVQGHF